jgi:hypothetical protein
MVARRPVFDRDLAAKADDILVHLMSRHMDEILDASTLPQYAHVINGWGNCTWRSVSMLECLDGFVHWRHGVPHLLQCHPEGDFHPWQTLAYAVMAGVEGAVPIGASGVTVGALARHSRELNTTEGRELGHLLYALATLDPGMSGGPFVMGADRCAAIDLLDRAVEAHYYGTFEVCRKFHLTEGICAVAARLEGVAHRRREAQMFLNGQLDMLLIVCAILRHAVPARAAGRSSSSRDLVDELRDVLVIGAYLENHCYYVGHLVELAELARLDGYEISGAHEGAIVYAVNETARLLTEYWPRISFFDAFLHLGHFRRAMTLVAARLDPSSPKRTCDRLAAYTASLDADAPVSATSAPRDRGDGAYEVVEVEDEREPWFEAIARAYAESAPRSRRPRGRLPHFRRVLMPGWPRAVHYEFLRGRDEVCVEIHAEGGDLPQPLLVLQEASRRVSEAESSWRVSLDPDWGLGTRVRIAFDKHVAPALVAGAMGTVIRSTSALLDEWLRTSELHGPAYAARAD